jgi:hypothetical protein
MGNYSHKTAVSRAIWEMILVTINEYPAVHRNQEFL